MHLLSTQTVRSCRPLCVQDWSGVARELRATVAKLIHVEEALATSCTCMLCLDVLRQPTTCIPCGHTYCKVRLVQKYQVIPCIITMNQTNQCRHLLLSTWGPGCACVPVQKCLDEHKGLCAECGDARITGTIDNAPLEVCSLLFGISLFCLFFISWHYMRDVSGPLQWAYRAIHSAMPLCLQAICSKHEFKLSALQSIQKAVGQ
jgi:hypothetical protein